MAGDTEVIYTAVEAFIAVGCCVGNALVIWAMWTSGALRHATFCFIFSLAVAALLVGVVTVPVLVLVDVSVKTSSHNCLLMCCMVIVLQVASVAFLLAIAVDRCLRVCMWTDVSACACGQMSPRVHVDRCLRVCMWTDVSACASPSRESPSRLSREYLIHTVNFHNRAPAVYDKVINVGVILSHVNSTANPVVCAFKIPKINGAYRKLWVRLCNGSEQQQTGHNNI
ncbi:uncharacterized protein LOC143521124 [Brachyhypopomus gauderio]|uniref:uncharacterized protein LOC143521124 n=1 Tax=Brachyhypopomus gauderio TaxID=698409 RepID=UPI0040411F55